MSDSPVVYEEDPCSVAIAIGSSVIAVFGQAGHQISTEERELATKIAGGLMGNAPVEFQYENWKGEKALRTVVPRYWRYGTEDPWHPEPGWLLEAYDVDRKAIRTFASAKMLTDPVTSKTAPKQLHLTEDVKREIFVASNVAAIEAGVWATDRDHVVLSAPDYIRFGQANLGILEDQVHIWRGDFTGALDSKEQEEYEAEVKALRVPSFGNPYPKNFKESKDLKVYVLVRLYSPLY